MGCNARAVLFGRNKQEQSLGALEKQRACIRRHLDVSPRQQQKRQFINILMAVHSMQQEKQKVVFSEKQRKSSREREGGRGAGRHWWLEGGQQQRGLLWST